MFDQTMEFLGHFRRLTPVQRNTFVACFLGWSHIDAFDFFILIFCVNALAVQFQTKVSAITEAIFLTLAMRPIDFELVTPSPLVINDIDKL